MGPCWNLVNWTLGKNFNEILTKNDSYSQGKNPFQNVVWKKAASLSRPQCVDVINAARVLLKR